ncbi:MAG: dihydroorotate dehydrogenase electron transfer subunit [Phycisphaerales bacterium]|nr:MAG: dihydroorotate dehydrogenase electron transfer subunit [Phycisphaerales bacterium]
MANASSAQRDAQTNPRVCVWRTTENPRICDEHHRLTIAGRQFPPAEPGQFITLAAPSPADERTVSFARQSPFYLRRAFSIAGLRRTSSEVEIDVLYRVVGAATSWMAGLTADDPVSVIGPLGNRFPVSDSKRHAWLVAGGAGLPPVLWMAEALQRRGKEATAFYGARSRNLLPLSVPRPGELPRDGITVSHGVLEFSRCGVPVIVSTDDGSIGYAGNVVESVRRFAATYAIDVADLVVYACGPEPMLRSLSEWAVGREVQCYLCTERAMACGMGTCQSCVIPVRSGTDPAGWEYKLCCTDGPVFGAADVLWQIDGESAPT